MPVTAKLSQRFYQRLGDEVANELVDWFNAVDATYRADLQQLNEANFVRFEAKLDQRVAELREALERGLKEQTRWMFVAWASLLIPIIGLWMRG